jgi:hypothetical protein
MTHEVVERSIDAETAQSVGDHEDLDSFGLE